MMDLTPSIPILPPPGYIACNVCPSSSNTQITHLVQLDEAGSNGGRPTVCGLTRFDRRDPETYLLLEFADLPGWGMGNSGVFGPNIEQVKCEECFEAAWSPMKRSHTITIEIPWCSYAVASETMHAAVDAVTPIVGHILRANVERTDSHGYKV